MSKKITELTAGSVPISTDLLEASQNVPTVPVSRKISFSQIQQWVQNTVFTTLSASSSISITSTSSQLHFGTTNITTLTVTAAAANSIYVVPDVGTNANFIMSAGTQTIGGAKTFSSSATFSSGLSTNTISEVTADAGVTIDGLLIKDNTIDNSASTVAANRIYNGATWNVAFSGSAPVSGQTLTYNGTNAVWQDNDSGDVQGPASSTDNAIVRWDGTNGKLVQNSGVTIDDSNVLLSTSKIRLEGTLSDAVKLEFFTTGASESSLFIDTIGEIIWQNPSTAVERGRIYFDGSDIRINSATKIRLLSTTDIELNCSSGNITANADIVSDHSLNLYNAANGSTVIATKYASDVGKRFWIENSGDHWWSRNGTGTISHVFNIDTGIDGAFVLSDLTATAGILTLPTVLNTPQVSATGALDLTLTTANSNNRVNITRIPIMSSLSATITAFAGGGQANATLLSSYYNAVTTVASAGDSIKLATTSGMPISSVIVVKNCTATNALDLFPDSGSQIFYSTLLSANVAISVAPGNSVTLYRRTSTIWDVI